MSGLAQAVAEGRPVSLAEVWEEFCTDRGYELAAPVRFHFQGDEQPRDGVLATWWADGPDGEANHHIATSLHFDDYEDEYASIESPVGEWDLSVFTSFFSISADKAIWEVADA